MLSEGSEEIVTLIYYDFRGAAQCIRDILYYLEVPFNQILLKPGQSLSSVDIYKSRKTNDDKELPCLIDGEYVIHTTFPIMRHLCTRAQRQDLLGQTLEQRTLIRQIVYNFQLKKCNQIKLFFKFGEEVAKNPEQRKQQIRKNAMLCSHKNSGSLVQMITLKMKNINSRYVLNHITILDFLFYELSFYQVNLFGNLEEQNCKFLETINSILGTDLNNIKNQSSIYLKTMRLFKQSFENEPFIQRNKSKLDSYGVLCPVMNQFTKDSFRKVWLGPQTFFK